MTITHMQHVLKIDSAEVFFRTIVLPGMGCSFENMLISLREIRTKNITFELEMMPNIVNRLSRHDLKSSLAIRDKESDNQHLKRYHIFVSFNRCMGFSYT